MDKVAVVAAVRAYFVAKRRRVDERMRWRRIQRTRRRRAFVRRQARQRLVFVLMLAVRHMSALIYFCSPWTLPEFGK